MKFISNLMVGLEIVGIISIAVALYAFIFGDLYDGLFPALNAVWIFITLVNLKTLLDYSNMLILEGIRNESLRAVVDALTKAQFPIDIAATTPQAPATQPAVPFSVAMGATRNENIIPMSRKPTELQIPDDIWVTIASDTFPGAATNPHEGYDKK